MTEYPTPRELCGVYFRAERDGEWQNVCFSDMTDEEMEELKRRYAERATPEQQAAYWFSMARIMAKTLHEVGDAFGIARGDE